MIERIRPLLLAAAGCFALGGEAIAQAQPAGVQPTAIGVFKDWTAYAAPTRAGKVCYALATPEQGRRRSSRPPAGAYFFISNRPQEGVVNEISVTPGFGLKQDASVDLDVDGVTFRLMPRGDSAFMNTNEDQAALVKAMREGRRDLRVKATPARGRIATQTYSLSGLGASLDKINQECRPAAPKR